MKRSFSSLSVMMMAAMLSVAIVSCSKDDDDVTVDNHVGGAIPKTAEAVDLGLSVKWAPWNIGASKPSDCGEYFAWGEVTPKKQRDGSYLSYDWDTYKFAYYDDDHNLELTKYNDDDEITTLRPSDDAATANWGREWRMPTRSEFSELYYECDWTWTEDYDGSGNCGYVVKSGKEGYENAVLFLPAAGKLEYQDLYLDASHGCYWLSELEYSGAKKARSIIFYSDYDGYDRITDVRARRCCGLQVRAVCPQEK